MRALFSPAEQAIGKNYQKYIKEPEKSHRKNMK